MHDHKPRGFWHHLRDGIAGMGKMDEDAASAFTERTQRNHSITEHWTEEAFRWVTFATIAATMWALALSTGFWLLYAVSFLLCGLIWLRISWAFNRSIRPVRNSDGTYSVWKSMRYMILTLLATVLISVGLYQIGFRIADLQIMAGQVESPAGR